MSSTWPVSTLPTGLEGSGAVCRTRQEKSLLGGDQHPRHRELADAVHLAGVGFANGLEGGHAVCRPRQEQFSPGQDSTPAPGSSRIPRPKVLSPIRGPAMGAIHETPEAARAEAAQPRIAVRKVAMHKRLHTNPLPVIASDSKRLASSPCCAPAAPLSATR